MTPARARPDEHFHPGRDADAALELRRLVWGADHPHNSAQFFEWLSANEPEGPQGVLVRQGGQDAAGFASLCVKPLHVDGDVLKLALGLDYMIRPGSNDLLRGRIALRVVEGWRRLAVARGCSFGIAFPNDNSQRLLNSQRAGFSSVFRPRLMVRILPSARPAERLHPRLPAWAARAALAAGALASAAVSLVRSRGEGIVKPVEEFGPDFDELWREAAPRLRVAVIRDSRHLTWRYRRHPIYSYLAFALHQRDGLAGYVVLARRSVMGLNALLIVDFLLRDWSDPAGARLVDAVVDSARENRLDLVGALSVPGSSLAKTLGRSGFIPVPERFAPRAFRTAGVALGPEAAAALDGASWHFTWGDTDVV